MAAHAVWFPMVWRDARDRWPPDELTDARVRHWWDEEKHLGRFLGAHPAFARWKPIVWDVWLLYPPGVRWADAYAAPVASGRTIVSTRGELAAALAALPRTSARHPEPAARLHAED